LRITVLKSAGNFTRDECHDLNAEKIQRVKCFRSRGAEFVACSQFLNAGAAGRVRKFLAVVNWRKWQFTSPCLVCPRKQTPIGRVGMSAGVRLGLGYAHSRGLLYSDERTSLEDMRWAERHISFRAREVSRSWSRANLNGYQVKRKGWNPWGLAAILWRSGRLATHVFLCWILVGAAAGVGSGTLSGASATSAGACCGTSGTDAETTGVCTRVSNSTRGGPTLSEAIRTNGLATSPWVIVSVSGK
jgi:hypothetical protein